MKRFLVVVAAALALLVPTLTFAQAKTVYIPGAHPRVVVVPDKTATGTGVTSPLAPTEVIAVHGPMAAAHRGIPRVNYAAVDHCDRLVAEARKQIRANF